MIEIDVNYPGGNVIVQRREGNTFYLAPDLRDTNTWWFYYNFCVRGGAGKKIKFVFERHACSPYGPGISYDGENWAYYPERITGNEFSFEYEFKENENAVWFSWSLPYQLKRFKEKFGCSTVFEWTEICKTEKGRSVPLLKGGKGEKIICFSCRHHCCESVAEYVLEGVLKEIENNERLREQYTFYVLPFVDLDGVEDGDQGKNRAPHDHNRDYGENTKQIYNTTGAWTSLLKNLDFCAGVDIHDPWLWYGVNAHTSFVFNAKGEKGLERLSKILENITEKSALRHESEWDMVFGRDWNTESNANGASAKDFYKRCGADIACSLEIPYFPTFKATVDDFVAFGKDLAKALDLYFTGVKND